MEEKKEPPNSISSFVVQCAKVAFADRKSYNGIRVFHATRPVEQEPKKEKKEISEDIQNEML